MAELDEIAKQGRADRHEKCGEDALITNGEFVHICNPLSLVLGAYCATCGRPGRISDFTWIDTGEPIVEYRKRMFAMVPSFWRTYFRGGWVAYGMLLGGGIMVGVCWQKGNLLVPLLFGLVAGPVLLMMLITPELVARVLRLEFY